VEVLSPPLALPLALALVDGLFGAYLLWYAVRRQRRDKGALAVTALFLLLAAAALAVIGLLPQPGEPGHLPPLRPAGDLV
jgi:predicted PurR-regulated permease PerM